MNHQHTVSLSGHSVSTTKKGEYIFGILNSNFWKNLINFEGVVAKRKNTVLFKMVATVMGGVLV